MDEIFAQIYPGSRVPKDEEAIQFVTMKYILITPARNEEKFIEGTIRSVVAQTLLPEQWVIVDDGSTDRTAEIVESYVKQSSLDRVGQTATTNGPQFRSESSRR